MHHAPPHIAATARFLAGVVVTLALGYVVFTGSLFSPHAPEFQCVTIGAGAALITALVRGRMRGSALLVVLAYAAMQWGVHAPAGWFKGAVHSGTALLLMLGIYAAAIVFELLAQAGMRIGKFLIHGPLIAGAYFAVTPLANLGMHSPQVMLRALAFNLLMGIVIGNGVGFGVELVDLLPAMRGRRPETPLPQQTIPD